MLPKVSEKCIRDEMRVRKFKKKATESVTKFTRDGWHAEETATSQHFCISKLCVMKLLTGMNCAAKPVKDRVSPRITGILNRMASQLQGTIYTKGQFSLANPPTCVFLGRERKPENGAVRLTFFFFPNQEYQLLWRRLHLYR